MHLRSSRYLQSICSVEALPISNVGREDFFTCALIFQKKNGCKLEIAHTSLLSLTAYDNSELRKNVLLGDVSKYV